MNMKKYQRLPWVFLLIYIAGMAFGGIVLVSGLLNYELDYIIIGAILLALVHQSYRRLGLYRVIDGAIDENDIP